tara:strand:- start:842 stop:1948 length:1107 start_codon:yes stop_codon:yes gene_type:complete
MTKKIAIIAEFIANPGGIEKEILNFLEAHPKTDVYVGHYDPENTYKEFKNYNIRPLFKKRLPPMINTLYQRRFYRKLKLKGYDAFLLFGFHTIAAARHNKPAVWRSTQPLSYLYGWDGSDVEKHNVNLYGENILKKLLITPYLTLLKNQDQRDIMHVSKILGNSKNVKNRLANVYPKKTKDIRVVFPSVNITRFRWSKQGAHYLSVSRLTGDKNVDKIIKAFHQLPGKKLVVVGDGPQRPALERLAKNHKNIQLLGFVSEKKLQDLYGTAIATISATDLEDFGMGPIESMSAGKPAIAVNAAGFKETILPNKTGVLIPSSAPEHIAQAVRSLTPEKAKRMRKACEARAKEFSNEVYVKGVLDALEQAT